ncbi:hydroxymethylglutaryl-CoA synthase [Facklamia miroungae]|uniref:Hydroxymethylglutaryl-CoA synthase n=1 Tax=Facklamia miroungae TaxID=120956 RepID=A0A1G7TV23_9LACT|nr:hydroxymethylglutaryl-CoA synthase [Facklamia miroungae]NKZ29956.1 hydroxymethylglutaryl-CoA synthase [Facklamia miroungae]SDG38350.1 hydroxymethylglutaryl-CoA synthase [Facklamia miroungae]
MKTKVGIDRIHLYIPPQYVDMEELALARNVDPAKFTIGIGQSQMAVTNHKQDIVTLAINAALPIVSNEDRERIDQVIVATESAFDYSKAASIYLHEALKINRFARSYEIKEACYAGTAGLQAAVDYVRLRPSRKVLVVTTDIARYGLASSGEATQGAGAIAMLISANPAILAIEEESIAYTDNQFDFWRPQYDNYPRVDGKFSTDLYTQTFVNVMEEVGKRKPRFWTDYQVQLFHLPFTKMGRKAIKQYRQFLNENTQLIDNVNIKLKALDRWEAHYDDAIQLSRNVGNIYTGSLYLGLLSSLIYDQTLHEGDKISLFSYGSGAVAECFFGELQAGFRKVILTKELEKMFESRRKLSVDQYESLYMETLESNDGIFDFEPSVHEGEFYLAKIDHHRRYYQQNN